MKDISPVVQVVIRGRGLYLRMAERSLYQSGQNSKRKAAEILTAAFLFIPLSQFFPLYDDFLQTYKVHHNGCVTQKTGGKYNYSLYAKQRLKTE